MELVIDERNDHNRRPYKVDMLMFGYNIEYLFGLFLGSFLSVLIFAFLFAYAFLGVAGSRVQQVGVVLFTGLVAIGLSATGAGLGSYLDRLANPPEIVSAAIFALATLVVAALFWSRMLGKGPADAGRATKTNRVWRGLALVLAVPLAFTGVANLVISSFAGAQSTSSQAADSQPSTSPYELREIMLNGELAALWQLVDKRAPYEMDLVIQRLLRQEADLRTEEEVLQFLNQEVANIRVALSAYGPALTDAQRKDVLEANLSILRAYQDRPSLCADVAMTGGRSLTRDELRPMADLIASSSVTVFSHLVDARDTSADRQMPTPPTDDDYAELVALFYESGATDELFTIIIEEDVNHPQFCAALIAFLEATRDLEGDAGKAVRFETTQLMLSSD